MNIRRETYLLVAEEESDYGPGYLKLFEHNPVTDEMQLVGLAKPLSIVTDNLVLA